MKSFAPSMLHALVHCVFRPIQQLGEFASLALSENPQNPAKIRALGLQCSEMRHEILRLVGGDSLHRPHLAGSLERELCKFSVAH